jgi:FtsP/CotA-like multicopper oxidase with cupredoxin domain
MSAPTDHVSRQTSGLPAATTSEVVELSRGQRFELRIAPVTKQFGDAMVRMLAYNGSIPGPTLRVHEGSEIEVDVVNDGDLERPCTGTACAWTTPPTAPMRPSRRRSRSARHPVAVHGR